MNAEKGWLQAKKFFFEMFPTKYTMHLQPLTFSLMATPAPLIFSSNDPGVAFPLYHPAFSRGNCLGEESGSSAHHGFSPVWTLGTSPSEAQHLHPLMGLPQAISIYILASIMHLVLFQLSAGGSFGSRGFSFDLTVADDRASWCRLHPTRIL
ncbi:hypothetical protein L7F22_001353 [Adiantum nelumboides]|nr:hypothetical protein [Adiantum nelumboides]